MEVISVVLGKITDKEISLNKDNTWNITKRLLNDTKFIESIKKFDKVNYILPLKLKYERNFYKIFFMIFTIFTSIPNSFKTEEKNFRYN